MCFGNQQTEQKNSVGNAATATNSNTSGSTSGTTSGSTSGTTSTDLPAWLMNASQGAIGTLGNLQNNGYQAYQGPMVAPISPDEQSAFGVYRTLMGSSNPYADTSAGAFNNLISSPAQHIGTTRAIDNVPGQGAAGSTQDYMDPYLASVLNPQLKDLSEQGVKNQQQADRVATMGGAFGDARSGFEASRNTDLTNRLRESLIGTANSNAFNNAMNLKEADINRILGVDTTNANFNEQALNRGAQGGQLLTGLDQYGTNRQVALAGLVQNAGLAQRQNDQASLDKAYQEFANATGYPLSVAQALISAINGSPAARAGTTSTSGTTSGSTSGNVTGNTASTGTQNANVTGTTTKPDNSGMQLLGSLGGAALGSFLGPVGTSLGSSLGGSLFGGGGSVGLNSNPVSTESGAGYTAPIGPTQPFFS